MRAVVTWTKAGGGHTQVGEAVVTAKPHLQGEKFEVFVDQAIGLGQDVGLVFQLNDCHDAPKHNRVQSADEVDSSAAPTQEGAEASNDTCDDQKYSGAHRGPLERRLPRL